MRRAPQNKSVQILWMTRVLNLVKVDTDAQVNVLPRCIFKKMGGDIFQLKQSKAKQEDTVEPILVT